MFDHNQSIFFALTGYDLAGCYHRIIHTAAALVLLRIGIPYARMYSMSTTIKKMMHRIRIAFGDPNITYGGDGIGDGNMFHNEYRKVILLVQIYGQH